tara:strand:- start:1407 stop:1601 length:195 start_codon:yes stop_codon:yes gene_type:complete
MQSTHGGKVDLQSVRAVYVSAKVATRSGRKITKTIKTLIIDFTFTFTSGVWKKMVDLRLSFQLS